MIKSLYYDLFNYYQGGYLPLISFQRPILDGELKKDLSIALLHKESAIVISKLDYVKPKDDFNELMFLVDRINNQVRIQERTKVLAVVDISSWAGHTDEKYWHIFLKFISDMKRSKTFSTVFLLDNCSAEEERTFLQSAANYLRPKLLKENSIDKIHIAKQVKSVASSICFSATGFNYLVELIMNHKELQDKVESFVDDVAFYHGCAMIDEKMIDICIQEKDSLYSLLVQNQHSANTNATRAGNTRPIGLTL